MHLSCLIRRTAVCAAVLAKAILLTACGGSATLPNVPDAPTPGIPTQPTPLPPPVVVEQPHPPHSPMPPPQSGPPLASLADQYFISPDLLMTRHQVAHAQGHRGAGVTVAVVDSGFNPAFAQEFGARLLPGFNATMNLASVTSDPDEVQHGTQMARIIGGSGVWADGRVTMVGVAPDATIMPVQVSSRADGVFTHARHGLAHVSAQPGVRIVNLSFSAPGENPWLAEEVTAMRNAGQLMVAAAGNDGSNRQEPNYPARHSANPAFASHMLVAGSVRTNRTQTIYSQQAGSTRYRYLVAPGAVNIGTQNEPFFADGTSNSAAIVSGAAAVVWGRWSYLTADRVATILLETAEDLGAPGVDPVFGRGLVRLDQAMQPRGELIVRSLQGQTVRLGQTVASLPAEALAAMRAAGTQVQFRDEWDRHFTLSAGALFAPQSQVGAAQQRDAVLRDAAPVHQSSEGGVSFAFAGASDRANPLLKMSLQSGRVGADLWRGNLFAPAHFTGSPVMGRFSSATGAGASFNFAGALRGHFHLADGRTLAGQDLGAQSVGLSWGTGEGAGHWQLALHLGAGRAQGGVGSAAQDERSSAVASVSYGFGQGSNVSLALHQGQQRQQLAKGFGGAVTDADALVLNWQMRDAGMRGANLVSSLTLPRSRTTHLSMTLPTQVNMETGVSIYETLNFSSVQRIPVRLDLAWSAPTSRTDTVQVGMSAAENDSAISLNWSRRF